MLGFEETPEERLFKAALGFPYGEREAFIRKSAGDDTEFAEAALELLVGYEKMGGDSAGETMLEKQSARERWATSTEEPGTVIGAFTLLRQVGQGGMGTVWEARQSKPIERRVALKVIKLGMDTEEVVKRFERERQTLAVMEHPHIAAVYEAGATALGRPYFVMEYVDGEPVTHYVARLDLPVKERLRLMQAVCSGVSHAHQKGVIHRDLKPGNVLVNAEGVPKIIDFGIAKAASDEGGTLFTRESQMLGTPAYMSPEQATGNAAVIDTRSDIYSLGVLLYELLSGVPPFDPRRLDRMGPSQLEKTLTEEDPPRPSTRGLDKDGRERAPATLKFEKDLDWIVMKAIEKDPARRYRSVSGLMDDIQRYLDGKPVGAVPPTYRYRMGKFARRHRGITTSAAVVALAALLGLGWKYQNHLKAREASLRLAGEHSARAESYNAEGEPLLAALWHAIAAGAAPAGSTLEGGEWERAARATSDPAYPVFAARIDGFDVERLIYGASGRYVIVEDRGGGELMLDLSDGSRIAFGGNSDFDALAFSPDGSSVAAVAAGGDHVKLWPIPFVPGDQCIAKERISERKNPRVSSLAFDAQGERLAVAARRELRVLRIQSGGLLRDSLVNLAFSSNIARVRFGLGGSPVLGVIGENREFSLVALDPDPKSGEGTELFPTTKRWSAFHHTDVIAPPAFTPDGLLFVPLSRPVGGWEVVRTEPFEVMGLKTRAPMHFFGLSPDGLLGLVRTEGRGQRLYVEKMGLEGELLGAADFGGLVTCAAFAPGSARAVGGDAAGNVKILGAAADGWKLDLVLRSALADTSSAVTAVAFSPDGKSVLSAQYQGEDQDWSLLRLWRLPEPGRPPLEAEDMSLDLAMLNAATTLTTFGFPVPIPANEWWLRWENFRRDSPGFRAHLPGQPLDKK